MRRNVGVAVAAVGVVVALTGCGGVATKVLAEASSSTTTDEGTALDQAARNCLLGAASDEGISISFDTQGDDEWESDGPYDTYEDVACVLAELDTPDYVIQHIDSTRALDGQQTDEWGDFEARWTYHPDSGMQMTVIDRS